jgi:hypothetical protein
MILKSFLPGMHASISPATAKKKAPRERGQGDNYEEQIP